MRVPGTDGRQTPKKEGKNPAARCSFLGQKVRRICSVGKSGSLKTMVHCFWLHTVATPLSSFLSFFQAICYMNTNLQTRE
jgi:hypothetical protein